MRAICGGLPGPKVNFHHGSASPCCGCTRCGANGGACGVWELYWSLGNFGEDLRGVFLRRLYLTEWCGDTSPAPLPHALEPVATWRTQISIFITDWSWRSVITLLSIRNSEIVVLELLRGWCKQRRISQLLHKQQIYCTLTAQRKSFAFQSNCFTFILEKCSLL